MPIQWCSVAPLRYFWSWPDIDPPYELAPGLTIGKNPDWYNDEVFKETVTNKQYDEIRYAPHALMYCFESDTLEGADKEWKGLGQRTQLDKALEAIQFANMSLWIAKPTTIYYERVITFDCTDKPAIKSTVVPLGPLYPHSAYASELHFKEDLETSAQLTRAMLSLTPKTALWVAQYSLWTALIQRTWEARYLMLWTGLEGLFGPDDGQEITHKLSQRIAVFLHGPSDLAYDAYKRIKKAYGWRSKTVHGMRLNRLTNAESESLLLEAEMYLKDSLMKILKSDELIAHFSEKDREDFLDRLPFQNRQQ